jgi:hypothetical protein
MAFVSWEGSERGPPHILCILGMHIEALPEGLNEVQVFRFIRHYLGVSAS